MENASLNPYEAMFVVYNKDGQKNHTYLEEHLRGLLARIDASIVRLERWDERQLAYEIKGQRDGIFYLVYFEADGEKITQLRRDAGLSDYVLRMLVLRLDKIPTEEEVRIQSGRVQQEGETADAESAVLGVEALAVEKVEN